MLMVSDLLEVARSSQGSEALRSRSPLRFGKQEGQAPVVVWNVNRVCNMTCPHCYAAARPVGNGQSAPTSFEASDLSTEEGRTLLEALAANGVRVVIFSGGEPLLREDLFELIVHAKSLGLSAHLSSNGSLIDPATAERLRQVGVGYVGVSIDGLPAYNDAYRGMEGGYGKALAGLRNARGAGLRTGMRMTLTRENGSHLGPLLELAREEGFDRFYVSHLVYSGRAARLTGEDLAPGESRALLLDLFARAEALLEVGEPLRIVTGANDSDGPLLLGWVASRHGAQAAERVEALLLKRGGNSAGEGMVNIDARGKVHPDQFWQRAVLGDVRRHDWAAIMAHPLREQLARRVEWLEGRCAQCRFKPLCRGSHRERALSVTGSIQGSDPACVMTDAEIGLSGHSETGGDDAARMAAV